MRITILIILFLLFAFVLGKGFNPISYEPSRLDTHRIFLRTQYFGEGLGKVYKNRFGVLYFDKVFPVKVKFETIFFSSLDSVLIFLPLYCFLFYRGYKKAK